MAKLTEHAASHQRGGGPPVLTTIIGRDHSGTRAMSHTLSASGVWMGEPLNNSGDLLPPQAMYEASRLIARHVRWLGGLEWDFSRLHTMRIPPEFEPLIRSYLQSVLTSPAEHRGWKIPETTLTFPWIVRMLPNVRYILWIRNPRDCIVGRHITDNLNHWGIACPPTDNARLRGAMSWKYQYDLVRATPRPRHGSRISSHQRQDETLTRLESYLGVKLARIRVNPEAVGRWKTDPGTNYYVFFAPAMEKYGYEIPPTAAEAAAEG